VETNYAFQGNIARELHRLFDFPDDHQRYTKARQIVRAVFEAITIGLRRGEDVRVNGFGIFRIIDYTPKPSRMHFITQSAIKSPALITHRTRKKVIFIPSEQLRAMVNGPKGPTTWDEQRAMSIWPSDNNE
jgi:nucleoid DNA-binding protein